MKRSLKRECLQRLQSTFGLNDYRPGQREAVYALLSGRDAMCILPTGAGKSLCWQLPAVVHTGLTVIVSPLLALMRDQVQHLAAIGVPALSLDSLMTAEEKSTALARIRQGIVRIVFVSPERLMQTAFRQLCAMVCPWLLVVDEAHCVVQWGESFRPAYAAIGAFLSALPRRPVLCALTATADAAMQLDIRNQLRMRRVKRVMLPILRQNLVYDVRTTLHRTGEMLRLLREAPCKTVIFCRSRARTEALADKLRQCGVHAEAYHAGLPREERLAIQQRFQRSETIVLCATTAFGLGVDIPDIRRVIHDALPDNLIEYVQQTGRAGRDGQTAQCLLFLEPNELVAKAFLRSRLKAMYPRRPLRRWLHARRSACQLNQLLRVLLQGDCIPAGITAAFGSAGVPCGCCSACRKGPVARSVPSLMNMRPWQIRAWLLMWQRASLAAKLGCAPGEIASDHAIRMAAKRYVFPDETPVRPEMARLLEHFRRGGMHAPGDGGI